MYEHAKTLMELNDWFHAHFNFFLALVPHSESIPEFFYRQYNQITTDYTHHITQNWLCKINNIF